MHPACTTFCGTFLQSYVYLVLCAVWGGIVGRCDLHTHDIRLCCGCALAVFRMRFCNMNKAEVSRNQAKPSRALTHADMAHCAPFTPRERTWLFGDHGLCLVCYVFGAAFPDSIPAISDGVARAMQTRSPYVSTHTRTFGRPAKTEVL